MNDILYIIFIVLAVFLLIKIISAPIKLIFKLILNACLGFVMLFVVNLIGSAFGFSIEPTALNCIVSGILGIPGIIFLVLFNILL